MELKDSINQGIKPYRESTSGIYPEKKCTQQGVKITNQDEETAIYEYAQAGDECSWGYHPPRTTALRQGLGSWSQATPAILRNSDSRVVPILDKTLSIDTDYGAKDQKVTAGDEYNKVRVAEETADGVCGVLLTCLNQESEEQIFLPMSENKIKVDHKTAPNVSTKIYDIDALGAIDLTNIGTTKDFLFNNANRTCIHTEANFHQMSTTNQGEIEFQTSAYPAITTPTTPANYKVNIAFDGSKWKGYCIGEATANQTYYAKIRWNYDYNYITNLDNSLGELMNYDTATDTFLATGTFIHIDTIKSTTAQFYTAGTSTIFEVRLLNTAVTRGSLTYDLYYVTRCILDKGDKITNLETLTTDIFLNQIKGYLLSTDLAPVNNTQSRIKTSLLGVDGDNIMVVNIPKEWYIEQTTEVYWKYIVLQKLETGLNMWFKPINPVYEDFISPNYVFNLFDSNGNVISKYLLKG
jgi:hypothetical protein